MKYAAGQIFIITRANSELFYFQLATASRLSASGRQTFHGKNVSERSDRAFLMRGSRVYFLVNGIFGREAVNRRARSINSAGDPFIRVRYIV